MLPFTAGPNNLQNYESIDFYSIQNHPIFDMMLEKDKPNWVDIQTNEVGSKLPILKRMF